MFVVKTALFKSYNNLWVILLQMLSENMLPYIKNKGKVIIYIAKRRHFSVVANKPKNIFAYELKLLIDKADKETWEKIYTAKGEIKQWQSIDTIIKYLKKNQLDINTIEIDFSEPE